MCYVIPWTEKQAKVVYREIKRGNLVVPGKFSASRVYDHAGVRGLHQGHSEFEEAENRQVAELNYCLQAIFEKDLEKAQEHLDGFYEQVRRARRAWREEFGR